LCNPDYLAKVKSHSKTTISYMPLKNDVPQKQRALVIQGGGALGAYEAGALSILCNYLSHEDETNNEKKIDHYLISLLVHQSVQ